MGAVMVGVQALVVLAAILMGVRTSGVGIGLWGAVGVAVLVFGFGLPMGSPPVDALLIIVAVVVATSAMQAAGGIDWLVLVAARLIVRRPRSITVVAPVVALLLSALAGTSNILFSLLPVIQQVSRRAGVRPVKPLAMSVVATSIALATSPVSAAMAAMVTIMDAQGGRGWSVAQLIALTMPVALVGVVATALLVQRFGGRDDLPAASGEGSVREALRPLEEKVTARGRATALIYLVGVLVIVLFGMVKVLRPESVDGGPVGMAAIIQVVMLATGAVIAWVGRPDMHAVPSMSIFQGGMVAAVAFFGLAWMLDTFLKAHTDSVARVLGETVGRWPWVMVLAVFAVAVLTTSQSTATKMIVPIGLSAGLPVGLAAGLWVGALGGIYLLPTNGLQIAAAQLDDTGSTRLGTRLWDNSFFVPSLVLTVITSAVGGLVGFALAA